MAKQHAVRIDKKTGEIIAIHNDDLAEVLEKVGKIEIARASHVNHRDGGWYADLAPSSGPILGPFKRRDAAIAAEIAWLSANVIGA